MRRSERDGNTRKDRGSALGPYRAIPPAGAPRFRPHRAASGAFLVFAATVLGPATLVAVSYATFVLRTGHLIPSFQGIGYTSPGDPSGVLSALLWMVLVAGVHRLTAGGRADGISDGLRAATRAAVIANAANAALIVVTLALDDRTAFQFFNELSGWTLHPAEALLALVAARHLTRAGRGRAATAARCLAAALPAASVAEYLLKRTTRDDMYNTLPARHAYLVLPINVGLWIGKLVLFGALCRVLTKGTKEEEKEKEESSERDPGSSRLPRE